MDDPQATRETVVVRQDGVRLGVSLKADLLACFAISASRHRAFSLLEVSTCNYVCDLQGLCLSSFPVGKGKEGPSGPRYDGPRQNWITQKSRGMAAYEYEGDGYRRLNCLALGRLRFSTASSQTNIEPSSNSGRTESGARAPGRRVAVDTTCTIGLPRSATE